MIATMLMITLAVGSLTGCGSVSEDTSETIAQTEDSEESGESEENEEEIIEENPEENEEEIVEENPEVNEYYEKGQACLYGLDGSEVDLESACANFQKAVELGKTDANFYLGVLCDYYACPTRDYEQAKAYYEENEDNPLSTVALGLLYYNGNGVEADQAHAEELFQTAIDQGCMEGYLGSALCTLYTTDRNETYESFDKALEGTEQLYVAMTYYELYEAEEYFPQGESPDYDKSFEYLEKAVELGNPDAIDMMGCLYFNGDYHERVEKDENEGLKWLERAAELGNSNAMLSVGSIYEYATEVYVNLDIETDYEVAKQWYEKLVEMGDDKGLYGLGGLYENGHGVEKDYSKALEYYEQAADLGNEQAEESAKYLKEKMQ
jgi:TPR repeat protein